MVKGEVDDDVECDQKRNMIGVDRRLFPTRSDFLTSSNSFMKIWDDIVENGIIYENPNNPKNTTENKMFMKICFVPRKINPGEFVDTHRIDQDGLEHRFDECDSSSKIEKFGLLPTENSFLDFIHYVVEDILHVGCNIKRNTQIVVKSVCTIDIKSFKDKKLRVGWGSRTKVMEDL
ncbi:hypothetical protein LIER_17581 [Lithospermum erythrorhizon]|uniref:Uncharacterized protein n=1 Tax=Lithospermum erythrorhizon TaxID=34254 RepID=A0AAV3QGC0_LITER